MKLFLAADHAGFKLKEAIKKSLAKKYELIDITPVFVKDDDYPLIAKKLIKKIPNSKRETQNVGHGTLDVGRGTWDVRRGIWDMERGTRVIFVCGSGVGAAIASNRHKGIRAAQGYDKQEVKLAREHNDINVLTLSGWNTKLKDALSLIEVFLKTPVSRAPRHKRRIKQLSAIR